MLYAVLFKKATWYINLDICSLILGKQICFVILSVRKFWSDVHVRLMDEYDCSIMRNLRGWEQCAVISNKDSSSSRVKDRKSVCMPQQRVLIFHVAPNCSEVIIEMNKTL